MTADEGDREERDPTRDGLREGDPARRPRSKWIGEERVERMRSGETETSERTGTEREIRRGGVAGESGKTETSAAKREAERERDTAERRGERIRRDLTGDVRLRGERARRGDAERRRREEGSESFRFFFFL
ncbi:hypothetical protein F2Q69_00050893 [Brassica cretica]|uniref:Uncharacterized protein n=1 Tax=Brassica cretica TaxID=69181 RepID=A0A8S9PU04_BRACR|nr:hypothetical protein F2Q69_00050893 [Brassica cretica]